MSDRTLVVHLDGTPVGALAMSAGGALSFTYDTPYAARPDATPLSLSMPLRSRSYGNGVVLPFLQGLLLDNPLALESMSRRYQVSPNSPFALLEHVGHDVAGALQIIPPGDVSEDATADRMTLPAMDDAQLADALRNIIDVYDRGAAMRGAQRMSLAGAQAKLGVARTRDGRWAMPMRGVPTTHILKPQPSGEGPYPDSDVVEFFCQSVVENAGIPSAHTELWTSPDGEVRAIVSPAV